MQESTRRVLKKRVQQAILATTSPSTKEKGYNGFERSNDIINMSGNMFKRKGKLTHGTGVLFPFHENAIVSRSNRVNLFLYLLVMWYL